MIAPDGYMNFFEIAEWAREVARDLAWAKRTVCEENVHRLVQIPGERDALECWAMAEFLANPYIMVCSPQGVLLRAPANLRKHLDQIEILPVPLPIEETSLKLPNFGKNFEIRPHYYFRNRFAFFDWNLGCIDTSSAESGVLIGANDQGQFSADTSGYLLEIQSRLVEALGKFNGWSICAKESDIGETLQELYSAFGVNEALIGRLELEDSGYFSFFGKPVERKPRKRDRALQVYERFFPNGHEAEGFTLKEATNQISEEIGAIISVDTMRRALGKKK